MGDCCNQTFNITVNEFDTKKSACCKKMLVVIELGKARPSVKSPNVTDLLIHIFKVVTCYKMFNIFPVGGHNNFLFSDQSY